ncbi:bifunctional serine/threonine-protein kinase/ABC transporter substrate-binding protein [Streptomyces sp. NBC_00988]|uniref:bifunctional serine/threonine-protein kinase/ABC transporter substrate-binding protein n=1 Tax=Streptomyces sp. NBC_00988 TaxID=2903704 RepID=UPI0038650FAE|nr:bifunctional serine/threonine-protein kinase/ABC transporter substrate-binding protein [Streptomyces sp. NBC_00988]
MSEPLRSSDPSRLAEFRLLRRLGAGGMGVVYLGRTDSGALAAVKVIRGESAGDDDFRARFAREVELARRVDSPWVVPVLDADAETREPWLATAFVPGPSVAEAVADHGPLPAPAVRVLGRLLAEALAAVHTAGLVHRDVKPGNVLLALDGPRLIDFGIARAADDTALTASGLVVGTPGFLAPEQAQGQPAVSASDVFALGCVLAYAATGAPPFGTGTPDALVYRTVHDEPELGRLDGELRTLVERCLAKDPATRPTAEDIRDLLADDTPDASGGWLPDPVARMVAARATESLAFPDIEPTVVDDPAVPARHPGRRRLLLAGGALLLAGGGTGAAVWASGDDEKPSASVTRPVYVLGVHTTTGTAEAAVSRASERAARLAVAEHNATPKRTYDLKVKVLADRGDADTAQEVARTFTADRDVVAVLGPVAELPMQRAAAVYGAAGLTHVSSSTGQQDYFLTSPKTSFQTGPAHAALGGWIGLHAYITQQVVPAGVVIDRAGGSAMQDEGTQVVGNWRNILKSEVVPRVVAEDTDDGPKAVRELLAAGVEAFVYLGALDATVRTAQTLATAGFTGPRWMQHQLYGSDFPRLAGTAGDGWFVVTDAVDPSVLTTRRAKDFTAAWRKRYGSTPEPCATEAYDSVGMLLAEFARTVPAGARRRPVRADLAVRLAKVKYRGIARTYAFGDFHQYDNSSTGWADETFVHVVRGGRFRQLGSLGDLNRAAQGQG